MGLSLCTGGKMGCDPPDGRAGTDNSGLSVENSGVDMSMRQIKERNVRSKRSSNSGRRRESSRVVITLVESAVVISV